MIPIERLKELEAKATPGPWESCLGSGQNVCTALAAPGINPPGGQFGGALVADFCPDYFWNEGRELRWMKDHRPDMSLVQVLRALAPHLIALWEAVREYRQSVDSADRAACLMGVMAADDALNAAAKEVMP